MCLALRQEDSSVVLLCDAIEDGNKVVIKMSPVSVHVLVFEQALLGSVTHLFIIIIIIIIDINCIEHNNIDKTYI